MENLASSEPGEASKRTAELDTDALFERLKGWCRRDREHLKEWYTEAKEAFDFRDNRQWDEKTKELLETQGRPASTFNMVGNTVEAVAGYEIANRQETSYLPRRLGVTGVSEVVTAAAKYFRDQTMAEDEESAAFKDAATCGVGWTETYIDFDSNPDGDYRKKRVSPFEISYDMNARQDNLSDGRRVCRYRKMSCLEAESMFPGIERDELNASWVEDTDEEGKQKDNDPRNRYNEDESKTYADDKEITIVCVEWWDYEPFVRYEEPVQEQPPVDPMMGMPPGGIPGGMPGGMPGMTPNLANVAGGPPDIPPGFSPPNMPGFSGTSQDLGNPAGNVAGGPPGLPGLPGLPPQPQPPPKPKPKVETVPVEEFEITQRRAEMMGIPIVTFARQRKKVYYKAFLGQKAILGEKKTPPAEEYFTLQAITAKRDENKGTFYGLVRAMKDPQQWVNKLFSQTMSILNKSAKGGLLAELTAFENPKKAMEDWGRDDSIIYLTPGAIANKRVMEKPQVQVNPALFQMLDFAVQMGPKVSGIPLEFLGTRETTQAGVLEYQRKQSALNTLSPLFNALRRYRIKDGHHTLRLIQLFLSDDRLIRIVSEENKGFLPLSRDDTMGEYEIVVDDAPSAPNMKEKNWQVIQGLLPVIGPLLESKPQLMAEVAKASPLPESLAQKIAEAMTTPPPDAEEVSKAQKDDFLAGTEQKKAGAEKDMAGAAKTKAETLAILQGFNMFGQQMPAGAQGSEQLPPPEPQMPNGAGGQSVAPAEAQNGLADEMTTIMARQQQMFEMMVQMLNQPKQVIRDPVTDKVIGIAPVPMEPEPQPEPMMEEGMPFNG